MLSPFRQLPSLPFHSFAGCISLPRAAQVAERFRTILCCHSYFQMRVRGGQAGLEGSRPRSFPATHVAIYNTKAQEGGQALRALGLVPSRLFAPRKISRANFARPRVARRYREMGSHQGLAPPSVAPFAQEAFYVAPSVEQRQQPAAAAQPAAGQLVGASGRPLGPTPRRDHHKES